MDSSPEMKKMHVPEAIIEEIMSRLDVESLLKFRCVSKSWLRLIDSERFIKRHLECSRRNREFPHQSIIISSTSTSTVSQLCMQLSMRPLFSDLPHHLAVPMDVPSDGAISVVGCCNGLVCITEEQRDLLMWNPSTRAVRKLPRLEHPHDQWEVVRPVLGWDGSRDAYTVFAFLHDLSSNSTEGRIYSSRMDSWKALEHPLLDLSYGEGRFVGGRFHWHIERGRGRHEIVSFDPESGLFGTVGGPSGALGRIRVEVVGGWLGVVENWGDDYDHGTRTIGTWMAVWVMKEYGVRESWVRLVKVEQLHPQPPPSVVAADGDVTIFCGSSLVVGWPKDNRVGFPVVLNYGTEDWHLHVESLVSPFFTFRK